MFSPLAAQSPRSPDPQSPSQRPLISLTSNSVVTFVVNMDDAAPMLLEQRLAFLPSLVASI